MAVQGFSDVNQLCDVMSNGSTLHRQTIYFDGNVRNGMTIYTDASKTLPKSTGIYLLDYGNRLYRITVTNGVVTLVGECDAVEPGIDNLIAFPELNKGWAKWNAAGEATQTRLKSVITTVSNRLKLTDDAWNTWNESGQGEAKVWFLSPRKNTNAGTPLSNIDIEDMRGFSLDVKVAIQNQSDLNTMEEWAEQLVHLPTLEGQNRRNWTDATGEYFVMPPQYTFSDDNNLMEFDLKFPDFELPNGHISVMQATPKRDLLVENYLKKGCSFSKVSQVKAKKFVYLGDDWLWNISCPKPYSLGSYVYSQAAMDEWCSNTSADVIFNAYLAHVFNPFHDVGYLMLNFETVGTKWQVDRWKIEACLDHFTANATALLCAAGERPFLFRKNTIQGSPNRANLLSDITFSGNLTDFKARNVDHIEFRQSAEKFDVFQSGGYLNSFREQWAIYILAHDMIVHRKFWPTKKIASVVWHNMEPMSGYPLNLGRTFAQKNDGSWFWKYTKPTAPCSFMQAYAVISHVIGDGGDVWTDGNPFVEDPTYHGMQGDYSGGKGSFDTNDNPLNNSFEQYLDYSCIYAIQPMKNIDWYMAGVWAISKCKDILDDSATHEFPDYSVDGGVTYITGNYKYPSECMFEEKPLVVARFNSARTKACIVAYNGFNNPTAKQTIKVKLSATKIVDIDIFGTYAIVKRINSIS